MVTKRSWHSCIVDTNTKYLYQFGGYNSSLLDSIEKLYVGDMDNIDQQNSIQISAKLSTPKGYSRAVIYGYYIYIIGGFPINDLKIDIINSLTDTIKSFDGFQIDPSGVAPVIANNYIFVFGDSESWQYYNMLRYCYLNKYISRVF